MTRPRKDLDFPGGYTRILNALLDRVLVKGLFTQYESQVLLAVARLSWGWSQPAAFTTYGELSKLTGIARSNVYNVCKALHRRRILVLGVGRKKTRMEISMDVSTWVLPREAGKGELFAQPAAPEQPEEGPSLADVKAFVKSL